MEAQSEAEQNDAEFQKASRREGNPGLVLRSVTSGVCHRHSGYQGDHYGGDRGAVISEQNGSNDVCYENGGDCDADHEQ